MPQNGALRLDAVIFGGGAAGLWLLDELDRRGHRVLLLEAGDLGAGQTIASQGIIHGGLKYSLGGLLTPSARAIRDMPLRWRRSLAGERPPDLRNTRLRSHYCFLWRTDTLRSRISMLGARVGLQAKPVNLQPEARPAVLASCPGPVARLDEQVIEPASFLADLSDQHIGRILQIDAHHGLEFELDGPGQVRLIRLINPESGEPMDLLPARVVLTAGEGNQQLRRRVGLDPKSMQRRPLHMAMARGDLPSINGHCLDGTSTRLTITSTRDCEDQAVWQLGGQVAERGVTQSPRQLIEHVKGELGEILPDLDLAGIQWATYKAERAEARSRGGLRPDQSSVSLRGNTLTAWPTKLALVPRMVEIAIEALRPGLPECGEPVATRGAPGPNGRRLPPWPLPPALRRWPRPAVALPPWEQHRWSDDC